MKQRRLNASPAPAPALNIALDGAKVKLDARLLAATAMFMATHDIRYYLMGVYVEAGPSGGAVMCATDGHQLALAYDSEGVAPADGRIIPISRGTLAAVRNRKARVAAIVGDRLRVYNSDMQESHIQAGVPLVEGNFPEWDKVVPFSDGMVAASRGSWSAALIGRLAAAAKFLCPVTKGYCGLRHWHWQRPAEEGEADSSVPAMLTRFDVESNFIVVTMPMRADKTPALPTYLPGYMEARKLRREAKAEAAKKLAAEKAAAKAQADADGVPA